LGVVLASVGVVPPSLDDQTVRGGEEMTYAETIAGRWGPATGGPLGSGSRTSQAGVHEPASPAGWTVQQRITNCHSWSSDVSIFRP
jgi:hypothetical protein